MRNIKLTIEYDGTHFSGWQIQRGECTVQGEIEKALRTIFNGKIRLYGSGRTDAGVHASGQVANFKTMSLMKPAEIVRAINGNLPQGIAVLSAQEVAEQFHAQYSAKQKTYRYTIFNRLSRPALNKDFVWHVPHTINIASLRNEAKTLIGKHDFLSFTATDPAKRGKTPGLNTVRTIYAIDIHKKNDLITLGVTANGFLYKMVRNIVGSLLAVATGRIPKGSIKKILKAKSRTAGCETAPAKGLVLVDVKY